MARKKQPPQEETLFDLTPYTHQPGYWEAEDEDIFSDDYMNRAMLYLESEPKSSHVERDCVERANFLDLGLAVGDTFTFNAGTDRYHQIVYQFLNGQVAMIADLNPAAHPGRIQVDFADRQLWLKPEELPQFGWVKSSHVARDCVQRANFQWVETYPVKRRYYYYRYSYIRRRDSIERIEKRHIPGNSFSIREGRAELVREKIAAGSSPAEIEALINSWKG